MNVVHVSRQPTNNRRSRYDSSPVYIEHQERDEAGLKAAYTV